MRPVALLLLLFQAVPPAQAPLWADRAEHAGSECAQDPAQADPRPGHEDHDAGAPCRTCDTAACPGQRDCARTGTALLATGTSVGEALILRTVTVLPPAAPRAAPVTTLFHPPRS